MPCTALQPRHRVGLLLLVTAVVDVGVDDDEGVLEHEGHDTGKLGRAILAFRLEAIGGMGPPPSGEVRRSLVEQRVGKVLELPPADVFVGEVACRRNFPAPRCRRCGGRVRATAGTGTAHLLPADVSNEERGAADVVRIREADQQAVAVRGRLRSAGRLTSAKGDQGQGALADAIAAVEQLHAHVAARVAAGVTVLDAPGDLVGGQGPFDEAQSGQQKEKRKAQVSQKQPRRNYVKRFTSGQTRKMRAWWRSSARTPAPTRGRRGTITRAWRRRSTTQRQEEPAELARMLAFSRGSVSAGHRRGRQGHDRLRRNLRV
jgi:hypothetical protein